MVLPFPEKEPSVSSYIPLSPVLLPTPEEPGASDRSAFCELFCFYQMVFGVAHSAKLPTCFLASKIRLSYFFSHSLSP